MNTKKLLNRLRNNGWFIVGVEKQINSDGYLYFDNYILSALSLKRSKKLDELFNYTIYFSSYEKAFKFCDKIKNEYVVKPQCRKIKNNFSSLGTRCFDNYVD